MTFTEIENAIQARMGSWVGVPVAYDGIKNTTDTQSIIDRKGRWVRLTIQHGDSFAPYKGDKPGIRRSGLVQCQIFTPLNEGSSPAAMIADSLAEHFQFYRADSLELLTASVQRVGPSGDWYMYLASVPFRAG